MNILILLILLAGNPDSICAERGHIQSGIVSQTLMCPIIWNIDYEDSTVQYYYNPNYRSFQCSRCGKEITEPVMIDTMRTVIWRRGTLVHLKNKPIKPKTIIECPKPKTILQYPIYEEE
jgi:hypothetical protein